MLFSKYKLLHIIYVSNVLLLSFLTDPRDSWNQGATAQEEFQNSFFLGFQKTQTFNSSFLHCSCPCTWSQCLGTCSSSWPSSHSLTCTHPCTSSSLTCPLWTSASPPPQSQRCCWTSRHREKPSPMKTASLRCLSIWFLENWTTCSWLWWPMTDMWPSVTPYITQS